MSHFTTLETVYYYYYYCYCCCCVASLLWKFVLSIPLSKGETLHCSPRLTDSQYGWKPRKLILIPLPDFSKSHGCHKHIYWSRWQAKYEGHTHGQKIPNWRYYKLWIFNTHEQRTNAFSFLHITIPKDRRARHLSPSVRSMKYRKGGISPVVESLPERFALASYVPKTRKTSRILYKYYCKFFDLDKTWSFLLNSSDPPAAHIQRPIVKFDKYPFSFSQAVTCWPIG
jgi:hypothetical protein